MRKLELLPLDDLEGFQNRMRLREINKGLPKLNWVRQLRERDYVDAPPYNPIKPSDMPLDKYLAYKAAKKENP